MCVGIPMQVIEADADAARARGRDGERRIGTRLVGACAPGDWLLVFLDDARDRLSAQRAAEIDAVLDLLGDALAGDAGAAQRDAGFALPSALSPAALRNLVGAGAALTTAEETSAP